MTVSSKYRAPEMPKKLSKRGEIRYCATVYKWKSFDWLLKQLWNEISTKQNT